MGGGLAVLARPPGEVGTPPPPKFLAHSPLWRAVPFVCVCVCVLGGGGVPTYVQELSSVDLGPNTHTQPKESALRVVNSFWRRSQMKLRLAVSFCDPLCVRSWHRGNGFGARGMGQTHWKWPVCAGVVLGLLRNLHYGAGFRETFCVFGRSFGTCSRRSPAFVMPDLGIVLGWL